MDNRIKMVLVATCLMVFLGVATAHENHDHQENETDESQGLINEYPSSATGLGLVEVILGLSLLTVSGIHYFRRKED